MAAQSFTVAGRSFRTRKDYEGALRDQEKILKIKKQYDFTDPASMNQLYQAIQEDRFHFETILGKDLDDEVYELVQTLKTQKNTTKDKTQKNREKKAKTEKSKSKGNREKSQNKKYNRIDLEQYDPEMRKIILEELKRKERRRRLIVIGSSLVAIACFAYFIVYYYFAGRTASGYEQLAALRHVTSFEGMPQDKSVVHKTGDLEMPEILDEYKSLYNKNKKLIGFIEIDDTNIKYPVMQTSNNEYYLTHNYNQEYDKNGSIFLDYECSVYPRSTNLIIYGHHMKSGQMFGELQKYAKESFYKEHSIIKFDTIYEKGTYKIMYAFRSRVYNENEILFKYYQFIDALSEEEFDSNMKEMENLSLYDTGVTASYGDELITLSTCDNSQTDGRFVVVAKRID